MSTYSPTTTHMPGHMVQCERAHFTLSNHHIQPNLHPPSSNQRQTPRFLPFLAGTLDVKFNDIGSLDHAKKLLKEIISLPLQRAELFSRGILAKSVSGVLLFGPPGTGLL